MGVPWFTAGAMVKAPSHARVEPLHNWVLPLSVNYRGCPLSHGGKITNKHETGANVPQSCWTLSKRHILGQYPTLHLGFKAVPLKGKHLSYNA